MIANLVLLLASGTAISAGVYLLLDRTMIRMILGTLLMGNGLNILMLQAGGPAGNPPIVGRDTTLWGDRVADPLAQAMILTSIVISLVTTAFLAALAYRQYRYRTADIVDDDHEDAAIAARPGSALAAPDHDASNDPTGRLTPQGDQFGPHSFEAPVTHALSEDARRSSDDQ